MIKKYIENDRYYTAEMISEANLFPWLNHPRIILNYLKALIKVGHSNKYSIITKPGITVNGMVAKNGNRYFIKGEGLLKILVAFEDGSLFGE